MSSFYSLFLFIIFIVFILTLLVCKWYLLKSSVLAAILSFRSHRLPYYPQNLVLNLQCSSLFVSRSESSDCKSKNELPLFLYGLGILLPCLFYLNFLLWLFFFSVFNVDPFFLAHRWDIVYFYFIKSIFVIYSVWSPLISGFTWTRHRQQPRVMMKAMRKC